jgi:chromosome segregation ATPase
VLEIDISKEIADVNFLILGIKYSQLFKRDITEFYDWNFINSIEMSIDNINKKIDVMNKKIEAISQKCDNIDQKCDNIDQKYENMNQKYEIMRQAYESMNQKYDTINQKVNFLETLITNQKENDVIRVELLNKKRNNPNC